MQSKGRTYRFPQIRGCGLGCAQYGKTDRNENRNQRKEQEQGQAFSSFSRVIEKGPFQNIQKKIPPINVMEVS